MVRVKQKQIKYSAYLIETLSVTVEEDYKYRERGQSHENLICSWQRLAYPNGLRKNYKSINKESGWILHMVC